MKKSCAVLFFFLTVTATAQDNDHHVMLKKDTGDFCFSQCFTKAQWEFHSRSFFMSTINEGALKDDYVLASGAGIGMLSRPFHGWQLGVSGFFAYNILSSDVHEPDSLTGMHNRYEIGMLDIQDAHNKNDLDRLEELYVKYTAKKYSLTAGKINLNTPFFNPQDGRMRPTLEEGVWLSWPASEKFGVSGGWIWDVSPRSTVKWFSVANSIGVYPVGYTASGQKSSYAGNISGSSGIGIANVYIQPASHFKINLWNACLENVMNTSIAEIGIEQPLPASQLYESVLYIHQDAINNGGNADPEKTYFEKSGTSNAISSRVGIKNERFNASLNYTHITGDGRYLMPREWGREPFYTSLPRERNEGLGNVHAIMGKIAFKDLFPHAEGSVAYGYYNVPDVTDFRLNKYGLPSYHQLNIEFKYIFTRVLRGLEIKTLAAGKLKEGATYNNLKYIYNKVNLVNLNVIFDFRI